VITILLTGVPERERNIWKDSQLSFGQLYFGQ
jgi:hypothetical protein